MAISRKSCELKIWHLSCIHISKCHQNDHQTIQTIQQLMSAVKLYRIMGDLLEISTRLSSRGRTGYGHGQHYFMDTNCTYVMNKRFKMSKSKQGVSKNSKISGWLNNLWFIIDFAHFVFDFYTLCVCVKTQIHLKHKQLFILTVNSPQTLLFFLAFSIFFVFV